MISSMDAALDANVERLRNNAYPGRGIILGATPDAKHLVQVYWIMGRSTNSRNRVFEAEGDAVRTKAFDESKMTDPSLIIYYPARVFAAHHIVTNGDQTDTIVEHLQKRSTFEAALATREFEPDAPNYTPRISGVTNLDDGAKYAYQLAILKTGQNDPDHGERFFFHYKRAIAGVGHCIHTYQEDGNPLPSFEGEPYPVRLFDDVEETARFYWRILNEENRVSLLAKFIERSSGKARLRTLNKHHGD
jgi:IMP cyclohydrolase